MRRNIHDYDHIIERPHHRSVIRPPMAHYNRAAQFAPFAALTGYEDAVKETARRTDTQLEVSEKRAALLDERLRILLEQAAERPLVTVTYFQPDAKKDGGAYVTVTGNVRRVDLFDRAVIFTDRRRIRIDDIFDLQGDLFPERTL